MRDIERHPNLHFDESSDGKVTAERVADYGARKKAEGMASLTVVVPAADVELFNQFAAQRREKLREDRHPAEAPPEQWLSMLAAMTAPLPPVAPDANAMRWVRRLRVRGRSLWRS